MSACSAFRTDPNPAACLGCIETDVSAAAHGPVLTSGGQAVEINFGGCIAHYDGNAAAGSCGNKYDNANDCLGRECGGCSDFTSPQTGGPTDQCAAVAFGAGGPCSADLIAQACLNETGDGGVAAPCNDLGTFLPSWCGGVCTAVTVTPPPTNGGPACQQSDSATCWPHDVTTFAPAWVPPVGQHTGHCTTAQVSAFYTACLDPTATVAGCSAWRTNPANTTCGGCLFTPSSASAYGALIGYSDDVLVNVPGCIALAEPCNLGCAQAILAAEACDDAACGSPFCTDFASFNACASQSQSASCGCSGFAASAACESQITGAQHPAETTCNLNATTTQALFTSVATFLCGP
jgi:hypothetical protein